MSALKQLRRLWDHAAWADAALVAEFGRMPTVSALALREYTHILGAEEVWLARLEARQSSAAVWPALSLSAVAELARDTRDGYRRYMTSINEKELAGDVEYTNSAGKTFRTRIDDVLLHVVLHGQYHRGKVNLLLRQDGMSPVPVDFIAYVRGVPAATTVMPPGGTASTVAGNGLRRTCD